MRRKTLEGLLSGKLIAILRGIGPEYISDLAQALHEGGISCIEMTFDQSSPEKEAETMAGIRTLAADGRFLVGAGTVLTLAQVHKAADAGAAYIISPNMDEDVIRETRRLELCSMPGALTPTEIVRAHQAGADIVKLFPAAQLGAEYIKAVKAPLSHIPLAAVGGVTPLNLASFFRAGVSGAGLGGNLVSRALIKEQRFDEITKLAREYRSALSD